MFAAVSFTPPGRWHVLSFPLGIGLAILFACDRELQAQDRSPAPTTAEQAAPPESDRSQTRGRAADQPAAEEPNLTSASGSVAESRATRWLANRFESGAKLHEFAAQRANDERVQRLARQSADLYRNAAKQIRSIAEKAEASSAGTQPNANADAPDLSEAVEGIGETIRQRIQSRVEQRSESRNATDRLVPQRSEAVPAESEVASAQAAGTADDAGRRNGLGLNLFDGEDGPARERLRGMLPALRENLPSILELVAEAVEEEEVAVNSAWVGLQSDIAEQVMREKLAELDRYQGGAFDQAYLGMGIVSFLELLASNEIITSRFDLGDNESLSSVNEQLTASIETARTLMDESTARVGQRTTRNPRPGSTGRDFDR